MKLKSKKLVALIGAVAMTVGLVGAYIGSTWAAEPTWTAEQPNTYKILNKGAKEELTISGVAAAAWGVSGGGEYASAYKDGSKSVVEGKKAGVVTVTAATKMGMITNFNRQIVDPELMENYTLASDMVEIKLKDKQAMEITTKPAGAKDKITWESSKPTTVAVNAATGEIEGKRKGVSMVIGTFTDKYGQTHHIHVMVGVDTKLEDKIYGPDEDGHYWKEVQPNVYQEVEENGTPVDPEYYIYDTDGDPCDENGTPCTRDDNDNFWIENPKNIWTPIDKEGALHEDDTIWGGNDFKPGTADDEKAVNFGDKTKPNYWVDFGENVYAQVSGSTGKIGQLTGGGLDEDPNTDGVRPIFDNTKIDKHYYFGPHTDSDGVTYYIGDDYNHKNNMDGLINTEDKDHPHSTDTIYYRNEDGTMTPDKPVTVVPATKIELDKPAKDTLNKGEKQDAPNAVITPANATNAAIAWSSSDEGVAKVDPKTGEVTAMGVGEATITATVTNPDNSKVTDSYVIKVVDDSVIAIDGKEGEIFPASGYDWVVIHTEGDYALVTTKDCTDASVFGSNNVYGGSTLETYMKEFTSKLENYDKNLPAGSSEKKITKAMQIADIPTPIYNAAGGLSSVKGTGSKVCFALSYQETNSYLKGQPYRYANYDKTDASHCSVQPIGQPHCYWLRSPGTNYDATGMNHGGSFGYTYNTMIKICTRPACWVKFK